MSYLVYILGFSVAFVILLNFGKYANEGWFDQNSFKKSSPHKPL